VADDLVNGNKDERLLEGLLMGKDGYVRESPGIALKGKDQGSEQMRLLD